MRLKEGRCLSLSNFLTATTRNMVSKMLMKQYIYYCCVLPKKLCSHVVLLCSTRYLWMWKRSELVSSISGTGLLAETNSSKLCSLLKYVSRLAETIWLLSEGFWPASRSLISVSTSFSTTLGLIYSNASLIVIVSSLVILSFFETLYIAESNTIWCKLSNNNSSSLA